MQTSGESIRVGVVGAGYWGSRLARNFSLHRFVSVTAVIDADTSVAESTRRRFAPSAHVYPSLEEALSAGGLDAVAIATPPEMHHQGAMLALDAGVHVLVEKPLATTSASALEMVLSSTEKNLVLMCDHTFCYTPAARKIKTLIDSGDIGEPLYYDSVRINLGLVQGKVDVLWDLAPHDLSLIDYFLPWQLNEATVASHVADPLGIGQSSVAHMMLSWPGERMAHAHLNWLSPTKVRTITIAGSERMIIWDDTDPAERVKIYDRSVESGQLVGGEVSDQARVSYRIGDVVSPALAESEALSSVVDEFYSCIVNGSTPATSGEAGLDIVQILERLS